MQSKTTFNRSVDTMTKDQISILELEKRLIEVEIAAEKCTQMFERIANAMSGVGYTYADAARVMKVNRHTVKSWINTGKLSLLDNGRVNSFDVWANIT